MQTQNLTNKPNDVVFTKSNLIKITKTKTDIYASWTSAKNGSNGTHTSKKHQMTATKRTDNIRTLKKSFKRNRDLINCNFAGSPNELFITLTYADRERGKNIKAVNADFDRFIKRIKRATKVSTDNLVWINTKLYRQPKKYFFNPPFFSKKNAITKVEGKENANPKPYQQAQ